MTSICLGAGSDGVVHTWDMRMRRCLSRAVDEGCFCSTSLAASPDGRLYATGSKAGFVNIYNRSHRCRTLSCGSIWKHPGFKPPVQQEGIPFLNSCQRISGGQGSMFAVQSCCGYMPMCAFMLEACAPHCCDGQPTSCTLIAELEGDTECPRLLGSAIFDNSCYMLIQIVPSTASATWKT